MKTELKIAILEKFGPGRQYIAAQKAGISESRLSRIILGRREPTADERHAIAKALGIPPPEIFPQEEKPAA